MKERNNSRKLYERPWTELVVVEMEGYCAGSTTNYDNAGSAGEGEYKDSPFAQFDVPTFENNGATTQQFDSFTY